MRAEISDAQPLYGEFQSPNKWPAEDLIPVVEFKKPILEYWSKLCALSTKVMRMMAEGLTYGHAQTFDEFCSSPLAMVRLLHYTPQPNLDDNDQFGAGAHTDFGGVTLLMQDANGGLQVKDQSTDEWIEIPPNPDAYVVNVGDILHTLTKGEYRSNIHRAINKSGSHRYSVPFFFDGNRNYVLRPLDGSRDSEEGMTVKSFMRARHKRTYVN